MEKVVFRAKIVHISATVYSMILGYEIDTCAEELKPGPHGKSIIVKNKENGGKSVLKIMNSIKSEYIENYKESIKKAAQLKGPLFAEIIDHSPIDSSFNAEKQYISHHYYQNGSLTDIITKDSYYDNDNIFDNTKKMIVIHGIAKALHELHKRQIINKDLVPSNILLDDNFYPKITDFDYSDYININDYDYDKPRINSTVFMAPEVLKEEKHSFASDIYSYGMILYFILSLQPPFGEYYTKALGKEYLENKTLNLLSDVPYNFQQFFQKIINKNPEDRPSIESIIEFYESGVILPNVDYGAYGQYLYDISDYKTQNIDMLQEARKLQKEGKNHLAFCYFSMLSKKGIQDAIYEIGNCYENGKGIDIDYYQAVSIYRNLARQNLACGQLGLALCYKFGKGVETDYTEAVRYLRLAADQNDPKALRLLGNCYFNGTGIEADLNKAAQIYRKLANDGDDGGMYNLSICYQYGKGVPVDYDEAFRLTKIAADKNNSSALCNLGTLYEKGYGVEKDIAKAFYYYELSASQGDPTGMCCLAECYKRGKGCEQDYKLALEYYLKAAEQDQAVAFFHLGYMHNNGLGVQKDVHKAIYYYKKASAHEDSVAQYNLGFIYQNGINSIPIDYVEAFKYYKMAADHNDPDAQLNVAIAYENGKGVVKNYKKAFKYYKLSADQGNVNAQYNCGLLLKNGRGVDANLQESARYYQMAALQNHCLAKYQLACAYETGEGIEKDLKKAFDLFLDAAEKHNDNDAQYKVGTYYEAGEVVPKDIQTALKYYTLSAKQNNSLALVATTRLKTSEN